MTFHSRMPTAACPGISWRHPSPLPCYHPATYSSSGSMQHPKNWLSPDVAPSCTPPRSSYFSVHVPWAVHPWQREAGKGAAPLFLGTKKQLIYVSETGCLERPPYCVCGSLSDELKRGAGVHCCPVITVMCRIHVELRWVCSLFFFFFLPFSFFD